MTPRNPIPALLLALLALALGACNGGAPTVPEGYDRYTGHGVSFAHPGGWTPEVGSGGRLHLQDPGDDDREIVLSLHPDGVYDQVAGQAASLREGLPDHELVSEAAVEVPGAERAELTVHTFSLSGETRRLAVVLAEPPDGGAVSLAARRPADDAEGIDIEAVVRSLELTGEPVEEFSPTPGPSG